MLFTVYVSSDTKLHAISMTYEWDQQQLSFQIEITPCYLLGKCARSKMFLLL